MTVNKPTTGTSDRSASAPPRGVETSADSPVVVDRIDVTHWSAELCTQFPGARASTEHQGRTERGINYGIHLIEEPLVVTDELHATTLAGIEAYLRICARLAPLLCSTDGKSSTAIEAFLNKTLSPFEHPAIRNLRKSDQVGSLLGALFGSDTWVSVDGQALSCEVNLGSATGGILENAQVAARSVSPVPISAELIEAQVIRAYNDYYLEASEKRHTPIVSLSDRSIAIVENDGYYAASKILSDAFLRLAGIQVPVLPLEAILKNQESGRLYYVNRDGKSREIDQVICDFYLESDPDGPIVEALTNGKVVGSASPVVDVVLGAKWTLGLMMFALDHPRMANYLGMDKDDASAIRAAFPPTYQHSSKFFRDAGINGFNLMQRLSETFPTPFAKFSGGGTYGGYDVYDLREAKLRGEFVEEMRSRALGLLERSSLEVDRPGRDSPCNLLLRAFSPQVRTLIEVNYPQGKSSPKNAEEALKALFDFAQTAFNIRAKPEQLESTKASTEALFKTVPKQVSDAIDSILSLRQKLLDGEFVSAKQYKAMLGSFSLAALCCYGSRGGTGGQSHLATQLLQQIAINTYMPYLYQASIPAESMQEVRVNGVSGPDSPLYMSALGRGKQDGQRSMRIVVPDGFDRPFANRHDDPNSAKLELELEREPNELLMIENGERFKRAAVLMSGTGRHARAMSAVADTVLAVDLSEIYIQSSTRRANEGGITNIEHHQCDIQAFLKRQPENSLDCVAIFGNSIIYLPPNVVREVLQDSARVLVSGGVLLTDFVSLDDYQPVLAERPVSATTYRDPDSGRSYERLVARQLEGIPDQPAFLRLKNLGIYLADGTIETTHDDGSLYLPKIDGIVPVMQELGFSEVSTRQFSSEFPPLNMMRERWAVRAVK